MMDSLRSPQATGKVISMQDFKDALKPHLVLACSDAIHIVPVAYIHALIAGEPLPASGQALEPLTQPMLAAILSAWLEFIGEELP